MDYPKERDPNGFYVIEDRRGFLGLLRPGKEIDEGCRLRHGPYTTAKEAAVKLVEETS